jgi:CRP-like cAMP-binding protein
MELRGQLRSQMEFGNEGNLGTRGTRERGEYGCRRRSYERGYDRFPTNPFAKRRRYGYDIGMIAVKKAPQKRVPTTAVSPEELLRELPGSKLITHDAGTFIFREGTKATSCYVITQGKVRILKKSKKGENIPLAMVKPGEFLGEMAMLSGERRSASAVALSRVKAIVIEHAEFVALLKAQHPLASRLSLQLSTLLATRCHHLLRLIARQPEIVPLTGKKAPPIDVRAVLNRVYTLWAV